MCRQQKSERRPGARALRVLTLTVAAAWSSTTLAAGWNTGVGGNSARDGLSSFVGPSEPAALWEGSYSAIVAQQAVIDGDIIVVSRITSFDIPTGTWIVAHDLQNGDILWKQQLPYDFPGSSWRSKTSAIRDGQVYATRAGNTNQDYLYALDENDGEIIWRSVDLVDESTTESIAFASDGDPIVGNFGSVMRIDKETGATVWSTPRSSPTSDGSSVVVFGDRLYGWEAGGAGPKVSAFDAETGDYLYSSEGIGGGFIQQIGLMVGPDGTVYAPRAQNNPATDFFVALEDTGDGFTEKWRVPMGYTPFASFAIGPDGTVYTYSRDLEVIRLDPVNGDILNTSVPLGDNSPRIAVDAEGKVYLTNGGFATGRLYAFDADLEKRWTQTIVNVNLGGPAIGPGGILIVCGIGNDVRAYQTASCPADVTGDGFVDVLDLLEVLSAWGSAGGDLPEDVNGDGVVDVLDLIEVLTAWGQCP